MGEQAGGWGWGGGLTDGQTDRQTDRQTHISPVTLNVVEQ